jgi:hypothetical protein
MQNELAAFKADLRNMFVSELVDFKRDILDCVRGTVAAAHIPPPPNYDNNETIVRSLFAETKTALIAEIEKSRNRIVTQIMESQVKTIDNVRQCVCNDVLPLLEDAPANNAQGLKYTLAHVKTQLESNAISGVTDFNFRVEWKGFSSALAGEIFSKMKHRTQSDAKDIVKNAFNVNVKFGSNKAWSSISLVALIQKCVLFRVRWWMCKEQNLPYPNPIVSKLIERSTYMNVQHLYSILMHIQQALQLEARESLLTINEMISTLQYHFPDMTFNAEIGDEIDVPFGVVGRHQATHLDTASDIRRFFTNQSIAEDIVDDDEDEPPLVINRRKRAHV